jgi:hypothetical protein
MGAVKQGMLTTEALATVEGTEVADGWLLSRWGRDRLKQFPEALDEAMRASEAEAVPGDPAGAHRSRGGQP